MMHLRAMFLAAIAIVAMTAQQEARAQTRVSRSETVNPGFGYPYDTFTVSAAHIDQTYEVHVMVPPHEPGARLPVLYFADDDLLFDQIVGLVRNMGASSGLPPIVLVGIGYPGNALTSNAGKLRARDLVSASGEGLEILLQRFSEEDRRAIPNLGRGAPDFLNFLETELIPAIERRYAVDRNDRAYFGFSAGGAFGEYVLTHRPTLFQRYITGSHFPDWWTQDREAWWRDRGGQPINARWYFGLGADEDLEVRNGQSRVNMQAEGFYALAGMLEREQIPGLTFSYRLYPNGTHGATTMAPLFLDGLRAIYLEEGCKPYLRAGQDCAAPTSAP